MSQELMFDVHIKTSAGRLQMIVDVLEGSAEVISVRRSDEAIPMKRRKHRVHIPGVTRDSVLLEALQPGPLKRKTLIKVLDKRGYAGNSLGSALQRLKDKIVIEGQLVKLKE